MVRVLDMAGLSLGQSLVLCALQRDMRIWSFSAGPIIQSWVFRSSSTFCVFDRKV